LEEVKYSATEQVEILFADRFRFFVVNHDLTCSIFWWEMYSKSMRSADCRKTSAIRSFFGGAARCAYR
jgi:hypothetical protein